MPQCQYALNPFAPANPFADAALIETPSSVTRFIGGGSVSWRPISTPRQTLEITATGGADIAGQRDLTYSPPTLEVEKTLSNPGIIDISRANTVYDNASVTVTHHLVGVRGWQATTSLGVAQDDRQITNPDQVGAGLAPGVKSPDLARINVEFLYAAHVRTQSLVAQEQVLALRDRLTLSAGVTADRNAIDGRFGPLLPYPRVSAAYRLPTFGHVVDRFELHAAFGQSGYAPGYGFNFNNAQNYYAALSARTRGVVFGANPNSNIYYELDDGQLRPERSTEIETGFEVSAFQSRALLSATVYQKAVSDLVTLTPYGFDSTANVGAINAGRFTNHGVEIALSATPVRRTDRVEWTLSSTFTRNYSRVDALPQGPFAIAPQFGRPYGTYWAQVGRSVSEIVNTGIASTDGTPLQVGDAQPTFIATLSTTVRWRRWQFSGTADWHEGGSVINLTNAYYDNGLFLLADSAASLRRLVALGKGQTPYVEPATFLKLRQVTLSYDLPDGWLARAHGRIRTARMSLTAYNLIESFRYSGLDPEVSDFGSTPVTRGQEVTPYPPARSFFLSVDLGL